MSLTLHQQWERLPDDHKFVDVYRLRLPDGWLVYAIGFGGQPRFGSYAHYHDPGHEWSPLEEKGITGPRFFLQWEKVKDPPEGFVARLRVNNGWFVFIDFEAADSTAQLVFCIDADHKWIG